MRHRAGMNRFGFTLIEVLATIVVLSAVAAVVSPIIVGAAESFADSSSARSAAADSSTALDRIVRVIREAPESGGAPDIATALPGTLAFNDGTRLELTGTTLRLTTPSQAAAPLCQDVTTFQLTYVGSDGVVLNFGGGDTVDETYCIYVRLVSAGFEVRTAVFLRLWMAA